MHPLEEGFHTLKNGIRARHWTMCQSSRCSPKGVDTRRCASKDDGSQSGVDLGVVLRRLEEEKSDSEDAGPEGGWLGRRTNHHL